MSWRSHIDKIVKKARPRSGEKRQYVYFGISFKERQENSELTFLNIYVGTQPENVKIIIKILN
jgi:hypothetical protein